jgi:glyoxylase-like metal-dependent hydrolase (beta-lactamase superfamily II)
VCPSSGDVFGARPAGVAPAGLKARPPDHRSRAAPRRHARDVPVISGTRGPHAHLAEPHHAWLPALAPPRPHLLRTAWTVRPSSRWHIVEALGAERHFLLNQVFDVTRLGDTGVTMKVREFGPAVAVIDERWRPAPAGLARTIEMTVGSTAPGLKAVTTRIIRRRMAFLGRWRQHNVEEAGNLPNFLPDLYYQGAIDVIVTQHYLACLSHASYLIGDETTGRAVVVDPRRDVGIYLDEAAERGLRIERVIETHIHADFLSGHLELADRTGAVICYGSGADVGFPIDTLHDGQRLSLGEVALQILATPGHTPESICVVVWEHPDDPAPYGVLTGDTLFVGDVGRPDLLASAGAEMSADALARRLYRSLREKLLVLPDATRVYPAHGAGSACGKALSTETTSTIGEQRRTNYALQSMTEDAFVATVTEGQPARPRYFAFDARANREVHPLLDEHAPGLLGLDDVLARRDAGAVLLDPCEPADFAAAHLAGTVNVGLQGRFAEWAGDVLPPDRDIVLVGDPALAAEAKVRLARSAWTGSWVSWPIPRRC